VSISKAAASCGAPKSGLVGQETADGVGDGVGLGKDGVFELGLVGAESVGGGDAFYRGIQLVEEFFGDASEMPSRSRAAAATSAR